MSDARWEDVRRAARSANRHFSGAIDLFENEDFKGAGRNSYRAAMAFMHAIQSGHRLLEASLLRLLDVLGEAPPAGEHWHQVLIERLCNPLDGPNARPAILSSELCMAIDETRRFRNLASRGYDSFDPGKAMPTVTAARVIIDRFLDEIDEFRNLLDGD